MRLSEKISLVNSLSISRSINSQNIKEYSLKTEEQNRNFERGKHPSSLKNLKKWKSGQSGNPGGRPTRFGKLVNSLIKYADRKDKKYVFDANENDYVFVENKLTYREEVLEVIWKQARMGSLKHIELLTKLGCMDKK